MTQDEKKYYDKLKADRNFNDYVYDRFFDNIGNPKEGIWFKLMGDGIPYISQTSQPKEVLEQSVEQPKPFEKKKSKSVFDKFGEEYWKNSSFGENSIFHPML